MKLVVLPLALFFVLYVLPQPVAAQDVITDTVSAKIDGVDRTITVSYTMTGVVGIAVAPITGTFESTATAWLTDLWSTFGDVALGTEIDARQRYSDTRTLLALTETTPYPDYYTPFVRQYRFAIHTCSDFINMVASMKADEEELTIFAVAPFLIMSTACNEQYQDAYVEMERIVVQWRR